MIKKTFSARYGRIRSMMIGLYNHHQEFAKYGASPEFLNDLSQLYEKVHQIQKRRKAIKKSSISATAAKDLELKEAEKLCNAARKWVRRELPADAWPEFGFKKGEYAKPTLPQDQILGRIQSNNLSNKL